MLANMAECWVGGLAFCHLSIVDVAGGPKIIRPDTDWSWQATVSGVPADRALE